MPWLYSSARVCPWSPQVRGFEVDILMAYYTMLPAPEDSKGRCNTNVTATPSLFFDDIITNIYHKERTHRQFKPLPDCFAVKPEHCRKPKAD
jgi:hypothetical protein